MAAYGVLLATIDSSHSARVREPGVVSVAGSECMPSLYSTVPRSPACFLLASRMARMSQVVVVLPLVPVTPTTPRRRVGEPDNAWQSSE
jgi:hypothetical protein